jgi:hypothetical protein
MLRHRPTKGGPKVLLTYLPDLPEAKPVSRPTPTQTQAVWATVILFLVAFWSGAGLAINALWSSFA